MLRILINSYTCCPGMGSEQGMGWNWILSIARHCECHVITEGEYRPKIEAWMADSANAELANRIRFYYNEVTEEVRKRCWNQGDWRFYFSYWRWQRKTADIARDIIRKQHSKGQDIDIIHQLNMIGFREPGCLASVSKEYDIPLVWGPVDAKEGLNDNYINAMPQKHKLFFRLKKAITKFQLAYGRRVGEMAHSSAVVIGASSESVVSFKKYQGVDAVLLNETGCHIEENDEVDWSVKPDNDGKFNILWVGKFDIRKQLYIAIHTLYNLRNKFTDAEFANIRLHIVGDGDQMKYRLLAQKLGVQDNINWYGKVSHDDVQYLMQNQSLLLFTSIAEGTPHVVLEAISNRLPVVCHNCCGHGDSIDDSVGIKIPLVSPEQSVADFSDAIVDLYRHQGRLEEMRRNCSARAMELSWDRKANHVLSLYEKAIRDNKH